MQLLSNNFRKVGQVYAPHDLSPVEVQKQSKLRLPNQDIFDVLGINPLFEYKVDHYNPSTAQGNVLMRF